jgi:hypothetical protein
VSGRAAGPLDLPRVDGFWREALASPECVIGSVLPGSLAAGAVGPWPRLLPALFGLRTRLRAYVEQHGGQLRAAALVYGGVRPEWVVLLLATRPGPDGSEGAFRLVSAVAAAAARAGMHRLFAAVPDEARARETYFQAGFYSYTRETWYVAPRAMPPDPAPPVDARAASGRDAHHLFRFYLATTPHAVQRAEQLSVPDFDVSRRAGAFDPPHLVGGNPWSMRRTVTLIEGDDLRSNAFAVTFRGADRHPHVCKVRTAGGDTALARSLLRAAAGDLPPGRPTVSPVRSYEEHVGRALLAEGFREAGTAMLFVKELAARIEEPALAPAVVR